ncbi:nucleotidyl cyclase domain-containing protein, partial [Streptomyces siamensis]
QRFEQHQAQVIKSREADAQAAAEGGDATPALAFESAAPPGRRSWTIGEFRPPSRGQARTGLLLAPGLEPPTWCTLLALDIEQFARSSTPVQGYLRRRLHEIFGNAVRSYGIQPDGVGVEDRGDGLIALFPPSVALAEVLDTLPRALQEELRHHNRLASPQGQLRLRAAVHTGPVARDDRGWTGAALNQVARMIDAPVLTDALGAEPRSPLALLVSDATFRSVLQPATAVDYAQVTVDGPPDEGIRAWVSVPGVPDPDRLLTTAARQQRVRAAGRRESREPGLRDRQRPTGRDEDYELTARHESQPPPSGRRG